MTRFRARRTGGQHGALRPAPRVEGLERRLLFAAVVRSVAGDADAVSSVVRWQFQDDLHEGPWGINGDRSNGAPQAGLGGSREITGWEGPVIPPPDLPGTFYRDVVQWGMVLSTPGTGFKTNVQDRFGEINPTYPATFAQRTGGKLFAAAGSTVTDVTFRVPGTDLPAYTSGFGVVFTDVDSATATTIELFDPAGASLGRWAAPAMDRGLSFIGVSFNTGEQVARARITAGNTPLGSNDGGAAADVVAIDDFFYGEPQPLQAQVHRFDGGTATNRSFQNLSQPLAWARDVVPPTDGSAVLEFPFVEPRSAKRNLIYDLPNGSSFDSLAFTGPYDLMPFPDRRSLSLRNGIRVSTNDDYETWIRGLDVRLTGSQAVVAGHPETRLRLEAGFDLNGHDLTLGGAGRLQVDAFSMDGSDGGRVIIDHTSDPRNLSGVYLRAGTSLARPNVPGGIHVRAGRLFLGYPTTSATPVRVEAGSLHIDADNVSTGPVTVNGGTLELTVPTEQFEVNGNLTLSSNATFTTWIRGSNPATPGGPPRTPTSNSLVVNGTVNLGGAAGIGGATGAALDMRVVGAVGDQPYTPRPGDSFLLIQNDGTDGVVGRFKDLPEGQMFSHGGRLYWITYRGGDGNDVGIWTVAAGALDHASPGQPVRVTLAPNTNATLEKRDLSLVNVTTGWSVPQSATTFSYDPSTRTATWAFTGIQGGRLPDGNYVATVNPDSVIAGAPVSEFTFDSFILAGDINRDRAVTAGDFAILAGNFGKTGQTYATGDVNGDGRVDSADFALLAGNFGKRLDAPPPTAQAVQPATVQPAAQPASAPRRVARPPTRSAASVVRHKSLTIVAREVQVPQRRGPRQML